MAVTICVYRNPTTEMPLITGGMSSLQNATKLGLKNAVFCHFKRDRESKRKDITIEELIKYLSFALLAGYLLF